MVGLLCYPDLNTVFFFQNPGHHFPNIVLLKFLFLREKGGWTEESAFGEKLVFLTKTKISFYII